MTSLLDPLQLGDILLRNRIIMAPAAGSRPAQGRVPDDALRNYYAQRAAAGLIVTEAASVSPLGLGYPGMPGIWNSAQVQGWLRVTQAVHERGGRIFLRLWHAGRVSDPELLSGEMPVAPSAIACQNGQCAVTDDTVSYVVPRSLRLNEIHRIVADFDQAARYARMAEFDGIEVHAGDGYLIDQFLHDGSNCRQDEYGGSLANRCRFLLEILDVCIGVWSTGRIGVHLSPRGDRHDMRDSDPAALYQYIAKELDKRRLAFVCVREHPGDDALTPVLRQAFGGALILNEGYDVGLAHHALEAGHGDAVAFGRAFVHNPDLVQRLREGQALRACDELTPIA
ncbi:alkene reductase [Castellaniella sp.]|uniref:alkene reductase n=1 Tax=Castellaniella sp. TaxID=1955812 RepID=UPI002B001274|nr:alkene reductase [Castellaniella sp.]